MMFICTRLPPSTVSRRFSSTLLCYNASLLVLRAAAEYSVEATPDFWLLMHRLLRTYDYLITVYGAVLCAAALKTIVQWNGERGHTYFFQAELPYDVRSYPYAGYAVGPRVKEHTAVGVGVYHFFRDYPVTVRSGITCPTALVSSFMDPFGVFLDGKGTMLHIINGLFSSIVAGFLSYLFAEFFAQCACIVKRVSQLKEFVQMQWLSR